ncbi:hypothetical protein HAX54_004048 [Datura stramonium]|uniref:Uncharacterized protein n=1 Tax=Datura stramonium TaxID=4076 RepID=A0ABS8T6E4_DATST|nr:hypothetical protein [Datura stramonium]
MKRNDGKADEPVIKTNDAVLKELVSENRSDRESGFLTSARRQHSFSIKTSLSGPKRKTYSRVQYFLTVGLTTEGEGKNDSSSKLKEVPVCFQSVDEYVDIFRPLILEEFKAQYQSSFQEITSLEEMSWRLSVMSVERIDDFHFIRCVHEDVDSSGSKSCSDNECLFCLQDNP